MPTWADFIYLTIALEVCSLPCGRVGYRRVVYSQPCACCDQHGTRPAQSPRSHHSDKATQYMGGAFVDYLTQMGIRPSEKYIPNIRFNDKPNKFRLGLLSRTEWMAPRWHDVQTTSSPIDSASHQSTRCRQSSLIPRRPFASHGCPFVQITVGSRNESQAEFSPENCSCAPSAQGRANMLEPRIKRQERQQPPARGPLPAAELIVHAQLSCAHAQR